MSGKTGLLLEVKLTTSPHARNDVFSCVVKWSVFARNKTNVKKWHSCSRLLPKLLILKNISYSCSTAAICWRSNSLVVIWSVGFDPLRSLQVWASPAWVHHAVFLVKTLNSNNASLQLFGGLGATHTCKNKTLVFNCEGHFHFHRFCLFYFFNIIWNFHWDWSTAT